MLLVFVGNEDLIVKGYANVGFMTDPDDFKSQPGYVFILNGGIVVGKSSKQKSVAGSMMEV